LFRFSDGGILTESLVVGIRVLPHFRCEWIEYDAYPRRLVVLRPLS
jgi:hypothetical protein